MTNVSKGDVVIVNDLIGFCISQESDMVILNTLEGERTVKLKGNVAVLATAQELAKTYAARFMEVCTHL